MKLFDPYWVGLYLSDLLEPKNIEFLNEENAIEWWEANQNNPLVIPLTLNKIETIRHSYKEKTDG